MKRGRKEQEGEERRIYRIEKNKAKRMERIGIGRKGKEND